jgi:hypothetical protein
MAILRKNIARKAALYHRSASSLNSDGLKKQWFIFYLQCMLTAWGRAAYSTSTLSRDPGWWRFYSLATCTIWN